MTPSVRVAILVTSDRCARGEAEDRSGPALVEVVRSFWADAEVDDPVVVPDEVPEIARQLRRWCDAGHRAPALVLTSGGTGLGPRDVTPEATRSVLERLHPGVSECMRAGGSRSTPLAWLSRGVAGTRGRTLVVNLPGSPGGAVESLECLRPLLPHALEVLAGKGDPHPPGETPLPGSAPGAGGEGPGRSGEGGG